MQCPRCRSDNPAQAKFCEQCGSREALTGMRYWLEQAEAELRRHA